MRKWFIALVLFSVLFANFLSCEVLYNLNWMPFQAIYQVCKYIIQRFQHYTICTLCQHAPVESIASSKRKGLLTVSFVIGILCGTWPLINLGLQSTSGIRFLLVSSPSHQLHYQKLMSVEIIMTNFSADHNLPFLAADKKMFPNAIVASDFACKRTKSYVKLWTLTTRNRLLAICIMGILVF